MNETIMFQAIFQYYMTYHGIETDIIIILQCVHTGSFIFPTSYDMDHNRFPTMIAEAKCRYNNCLDSEGNLDLSVNSVPIKQEILVLRREMKGCTPSFKLEKKMVTVGCTCVRPEVKEQQ
ncbi:hypothetical protein XELAEV_18028219mg [Xenopus laevis]|uniref:Interleukin-17F n=1 Tax=Xenopus laevis TaxID=8355 RepID=A0A974CWQ9_XENLA|nr:hypothetical protein XELAEV_18028219mg [Xenopus laevis]